jgi:hypothetical protein
VQLQSNPPAAARKRRTGSKSSGSRSALRFGVVQIVVHDAQVTQIEKTERVRLDKPQKI